MRNGVEFPPIAVFGNDDGPFIWATGFIAWRPIDRRIPTSKISNVRFTPATVTTHFFSPGERAARPAAQPLGQAESRHDTYPQREMVGME
jgi:hypothetical protein